MHLFSTGEVCRMLGIQLETLVYWERVGKITPARRLGNGKRIFTESDVTRLRRQVATAQETKSGGHKA